MKPLKLQAALLLALVASLTIAARDKKEEFFDPTELLPDGLVEVGLTLEDSTWVDAGETYEIRLTRIEQDLRLQYIEKVTGVEIDPFHGEPGQPPGFISFLLEIHNTGESEIVFNPLRSWLLSSKTEIRTPLGMTDISFNYKVSGGDLPPAYERIAPAMLDQNRTIDPGGAIHGLLVYRTLDKPKTKSYTVSVELSLPNGDVVRIAAPYARPPKKKKAQREG